MKRNQDGTIAKITAYSQAEYDEVLRNRLREGIRLSESGCFEWIGAKINGYGQIRIRLPTNKCVLTHRLAWLLSGRYIPDGMEICHKCDNRSCINIEHLFVGTRSDNMRDMVHKGRAANTTGERSGMAKLTRDQIDSIRRRCAAGEKQIDLARNYGIHPAHISRIVNGRRWPVKAMHE